MHHVEEQEQQSARGHEARRGGPLLVVGIVAVLVVVALATSGGGFSGLGGSSKPDVTIPTGGGPGVTTPPLSAASNAGPADATRQVLVDVAGAGSTRTKDITPGDGWSLAWAYDCSLPVAAPKGLTVTVKGLAGATPERHTDGRGSGVATYAKGGPVYLEIDSRCAWSVKVLG